MRVMLLILSVRVFTLLVLIFIFHVILLGLGNQELNKEPTNETSTYLKSS